MRQDARAFAGALERADDVQQIGVVALFGGRHAEGLETLPKDRCADRGRCSTLVAEGRIGDDVVEGLERVAVLETAGLASVLPCMMTRRGVVVQDHVHAGEAGGGGVLLLPVERDSLCRAASSPTFNSSEPEPQVGS